VLERAGRKEEGGAGGQEEEGAMESSHPKVLQEASTIEHR
jgi:hypothetical protein